MSRYSPSAGAGGGVMTGDRSTDGGPFSWKKGIERALLFVGGGGYSCEWLKSAFDRYSEGGKVREL